ncbi:Unknown protein, partial [Striga hermonthica]
LAGGAITFTKWGVQSNPNLTSGRQDRHHRLGPRLDVNRCATVAKRVMNRTGQHIICPINVLAKSHTCIQTMGKATVPLQDHSVGIRN